MWWYGVQCHLAFLDQRHKINTRELSQSELVSVLRQFAAWEVTLRSHKDCRREPDRAVSAPKWEEVNTTVFGYGSEGLLKVSLLEKKWTVFFLLQHFAILSQSPFLETVLRRADSSEEGKQLDIWQRLPYRCLFVALLKGPSPCRHKCFNSGAAEGRLLWPRP